MKLAIPVLIVLAALVAGSAVVRSRGREQAPSRKGSAASPAPAKPLPIAVSPTGTRAVDLVRLYREQRGLRANAVTSGFTEAQTARLRTIDRSLTDDGAALSASLQGNLEAWKDLIILLSVLEEFESARDVVLRVRIAIDPPAEALWTDRLRTGARVDGRRLALVALAGRASRDVVLALVGGAKEDGDARVRSEALSALAEIRRKPPSEDLGRLADETLKSCSSADRDPAVRGVATGLVAQLRQEKAPSPPPPARRPLFGRSSRPVPQNP